jgi:hypothetical protein
MKPITFLSPALTGLFCASALLSTCCIAQTPTPAPAPAKRNCKVVLDAPSPGDTLIARKEYKPAEAAFREAIAKKENIEDSRLGLVRALIGQDEVVAATTEAAAFLQSAPHLSLWLK